MIIPFVILLFSLSAQESYIMKWYNVLLLPHPTLCERIFLFYFIFLWWIKTFIDQKVEG